MSASSSRCGPDQATRPGARRRPGPRPGPRPGRRPATAPRRRRVTSAGAATATSVVGLGQHGPRSATSSARASASASPALGQLGVPHVERGRHVGGQPAAGCFSSALRWRSTRSRSLRSGVVAGVQRRPGRRRGSAAAPPGPPFTSARSSGANTVTRRAPSRSRARCSALAVHQHPVPARRAQLGLDQQLAARRARPRPARRPAPRPPAPAPRRARPGTTPAWPGSRRPRAGWSCPRRWRPRRGEPGRQVDARPARSCGSRSSQRRRSQHARGLLGHPDRHEQVQEVRALGGPHDRRLQGVDGLERRPRRPAVASTPSSRYSGLKATTISVPSYLASRSSWAWPTSWVMAVSSMPVGAQGHAHRRGLPGQQLHPAHGVEQRLAARREPVRVARSGSAGGSSGTRPRSGGW